MKHLTTAWFAAIVFALCAPSAHADSADDQYVAELNQAGVPGDRNALIAIGREACGLMTADRVGWTGAIGTVDAPFKTLTIKIRNELLDQGVEPGTQMRAVQRATDHAFCPGFYASVITN